MPPRTSDTTSTEAQDPELVSRFSVSLPGDLLRRLDDMVRRRELPSRSQALAEMIRQELVEYDAEVGTRVVAGTITLVYSNRRGALRHQMANIQHKYLMEVVSSQHVFLEYGESLEVLLVQGPADQLQRLADELRCCRGVKQVKLTFTASLLPPLHAKEAATGSGDKPVGSAPPVSIHAGTVAKRRVARRERLVARRKAKS